MQTNCIVNTPTIVNRFGLHTLHCNITHLAVLTPKTTSKIKKIINVWGYGKDYA